jgi:ribosomal protein S27E
MEEKYQDIEKCTMCVSDTNVFCPRGTDAKCLICGENYCGAHIGQHLHDKHQVSLNLDHCSR